MKKIRNKEPCRQHSTMSLKYQNEYPKIWITFKEIKFYQKENNTQKSGNSQKMTPKNSRIAQKGTQKSGSNPKKVPKIMAHPGIKTYASYNSETWLP